MSSWSQNCIYASLTSWKEGEREREDPFQAVNIQVHEKLEKGVS